MKNRFTNHSDDSLLHAVAHINVDPCDPSQDAMHEALSELTRRYARALELLKKLGHEKPSYAEWVEARQGCAVGAVQFERCRDLEG